MSQPPDMPDFSGLGHEFRRALTIWFFLRSNHGRWFTPREISIGTSLALSTVRHALSRIFGLPPLSRPRLQRQIIEDENGRRVQYRFTRIIDIVFDEQ